jgi:hypothetical protein
VVEAILVHSPLVGASTWRGTARSLNRRGWRCRTPSPAGLPAWHDWADRLPLGELPGDAPHDDPVVVVGHSAAGLLLPAVAARVAATALIFVDAQLPPASGVVPPVDDEFLGFVRTLADEDGRLPPWSAWWGDAVMERLVPDPAARAEFEDELPGLDLRWFDDRAAVPSWRHLRSGYVQLSPRFEPVAEAARADGWPVRVLDGSHVEPVVAPDVVATAIHDVTASMFG